MKKLGIKLPKITLIWIACFLALSACYGIFLVPQHHTLSQMQARNEQRALEFEALQKLKSPIEQAQYKGRLNMRQQQYQNLVFSADELSNLGFDIQTMAAKYEFQDFTSKTLFTKSDKAFEAFKHIGQQQMSIKTLCDFPGFIRFLNDLERHEPAVFVTEFKLTRNYAKTVNDPASASLDLSLLYEREGQ